MKRMADYRHELKFLCTEQELTVREAALRVLMRPDPHARADGSYEIRSVYFDDAYRSCRRASEDGTDPREKFRIRIYNRSDARITLEKKIKNRGLTAKQSCLLDRDTCEKLLRGETLRECLGQDALLDEWICLRSTRLLRPVLLGEYVRTPYVYGPGNVRITLDRRISASPETGKLFASGLSRIEVLPRGYALLEVKYDSFLPEVLRRSLDSGHLQQTAFSKFYLGCNALEGRMGNDFF